MCFSSTNHFGGKLNGKWSHWTKSWIVKRTYCSKYYMRSIKLNVQALDDMPTLCQALDDMPIVCLGG